MFGLYVFFIVVIIGTRLIMHQTVVISDRTMRNTDVYKWYLLGTWAILLPLLVATWLLDLKEPQPLLFALVTVASCFRGFMEWKYIHETKQHKVSMIQATISFFFTLILLLLGLKEG